MDQRIQRVLPIVLSLISSIGTVGTAYCAVKDYKKYDALKKDQHSGKYPFGSPEYKKELLKTEVKCFIPTILVATGTIASTITGTIIGKKTEASLTATAVMLQQGWNKYKDKAKQVFGDKANTVINSAVGDSEYKANEAQLTKAKESSEEKLYWEEHLGFFTCNPVDLVAGVSDTCQRFHAPDADVLGTYYWATLYTLAMDANANVLDKNRLEACKHIGWTADYLSEVLGISGVWIHPTYTRVIDKETGEEKYTKLEFHEDTIYVDLDLMGELRDNEVLPTNMTLEHNSEIDEHQHYLDADGDDTIVNNDLNCAIDELDSFQSTAPNNMANTQTRFDDGTDPDYDGPGYIEKLPDPKTIPNLKDLKEKK
jgi:hypothetical protein